MITSKPSLRSGFDCIIRPAPSGAGRTTPSQPGHYPLNNEWSFSNPDSKVHEAYMGLTWGRPDPVGHHAGPMNLAIREPLASAVGARHIYRINAPSDGKDATRPVTDLQG